jgi:phage terminase large subunit-like protein
VRDGRIHDPRFLPMIYEYPAAMVEAGEHLLPENFYIPNPNLGASVDAEYLSRELQKAQNDGAESLCGFLAKHLNVEIGLSLQSDRWVGADFWEACATAERVTFEDVLLRSEVVTVGIDGGGLDDLLGLAVLGREEATGKWLLWVHAWAHPIVLERRKSEASRFNDFVQAGDLSFCEPGQDVAEVADYVARIEAADLLDKIGVDKEGIAPILDAIIAREIDREKIVGISQGYHLMGAIKTTERYLAEGRLQHGGQPIMDYSVRNAKVEEKGNAFLITKQASGRAKIDPLMATFDAAQLMAANPDSRRKAYSIHFM